MVLNPKLNGLDRIIKLRPHVPAAPRARRSIPVFRRFRFM